MRFLRARNINSVPCLFPPRVGYNLDSLYISCLEENFLSDKNNIENELIEKARHAMGKAYAPYSDVRVGAALMTKPGRIFSGCNVENASYGLTICAERVAVGSAIMEGEKDFVAIAVVNSTGKVLSPCGACRQVLSEFVSDMDIFLESGIGERVKTKLSSIFPDAFDLRHDDL